MGEPGERETGFTLVELMVVVAIAGVLVAIAVPMFMESMKKSRATEAAIQLDKIAKRASEEFHASSTFPTTAAPLTPAADCCTQNAGGKKRCAVVAAEWSTAAWESLDFAMTRDFLFQYSYTPAAGGASYQAIARGDLDCDGTFMQYILDGTAPGGTPMTTLSEPPPGTD